jgi:ubiquitin-conjugating enzyme E2 J1
METDVQGQLGGMETTEAVRRRLAQESGSFKCLVCAKSNADIIAECEDRCKETASFCQEISVPAELNMSWRDELEAATNDQSSSTRRSEKSSELAQGGESSITEPSEAELAEGFVQTAPNATNDFSTHPPAPMLGIRHRQPPSTVSPTGTGAEAVPLWIDRVIVALVILLVAIVMKVLLGI